MTASLPAICHALHRDGDGAAPASSGPKHAPVPPGGPSLAASAEPVFTPSPVRDPHAAPRSTQQATAAAATVRTNRRLRYPVAMRVALLLGLLLGLAACGFLGEQVAVTTVSGCIHQSCKDPDARDYTACEAACRAQYAH